MRRRSRSRGLLRHARADPSVARRARASCPSFTHAIDDSEAKARRTLRNRLMRALPPVKVARYLQLEDKLQAIREYDIASAVPLVH